jgi:hypothetical protein
MELTLLWNNYGTSILCCAPTSNACGPTGPPRRLDCPSRRLGAGVVLYFTFVTSCILKPLTSVSGCLSARPTGCSMASGGTSMGKASGGSAPWSTRSATLSTTMPCWRASRISDASTGWIAGTSWLATLGSNLSRAPRPCEPSFEAAGEAGSGGDRR